MCMSERYIITLQVGDKRISRKLKTRSGNTEDLQKEIALLVEEEAFKKLAEGLAKKIEEQWYCDGCGKQYLRSEFITITTGNLCGVVLCPACQK